MLIKPPIRQEETEKDVYNILSRFVKHIEDDPDMNETPKRIAKMYEYFFREEDPSSHFKKKFPTDNDEMIIVRDLRAVSLCPHHLLPIEYRIHIGYIPNGEALGLSKFSRIARAVASVPILQENLTTKLVDLFDQNLKNNGVMVVVQGVHGCMKYRGVFESTSETITSAIKGFFATNEKTKKEFLDLIKLSHL